MARSPAFAPSQYAAPRPAAIAASSDQSCDHHLVDLLWFYGCVTTIPSPFCSDSAHNVHPLPSLAVDHGELCNSPCTDIVKPSHPSHQHLPYPNAADRDFDIGYCTNADIARLATKVDNAPILCMQQCAPSASPDSAKWLRQVFDTFDENKDGMLSTEELRRSLEKLGIEASIESIDSLLSESPSKEQKGLVSQDDFLLLYHGAASCIQCALHHNNHDNAEHVDCKSMNAGCSGEELLWDAFNVFDKDKDGFISPIELQSVLCSLGFGAAQELAECTEMIKRYDQDGDGQVDFEEFKAMLNPTMACVYA